ncbi:MAG: recombination mediator RecR [Patescibacteria group bacterium]
MSEKFKNLVAFFTKLPGVGPRHATRLILAMLDWSPEDIETFAQHIEALKTGPTLCQQCFNFADADLCNICSNPRRNQRKIAIVEKVTDLASMEKAGVYDGVYHVLGGAINPAGGVLPEKLKISQLIIRAKDAQEIILATNPNTYGETTALYLEQELKSARGGSSFGGQITRLARGLAAGTSVEYADEITLANALKHRK